MEANGTDQLTVCDNGRFISVITAGDLVQLDKVLGRTDEGQ